MGIGIRVLLLLNRNNLRNLHEEVGKWVMCVELFPPSVLISYATATAPFFYIPSVTQILTFFFLSSIIRIIPIVMPKRTFDFDLPETKFQVNE